MYNAGYCDFYFFAVYGVRDIGDFDYLRRHMTGCSILPDSIFDKVFEILCQNLSLG